MGSEETCCRKSMWAIKPRTRADDYPDIVVTRRSRLKLKGCSVSYFRGLRLSRSGGTRV